MEEAPEQILNITGHDIRLENLSLSNFRGFINLPDLKFNEQLTVLVARNGGGKTTILDAVAASLKTYTYQISKSLLAGQYVWSHFDLNNRAEAGWISLNAKIEYGMLDRTPGESERDDINLRLDLNRVGVRAKINGLSAEAESAFEFGVLNSSDISEKYDRLPVIAYFGKDKNNSSYLVAPIDSGNSNIVQVFANCLEPRRLNFAVFLQWFEKVYKLANYSETNNGLSAKMLSIITTVVEKALRKFNEEEDKEDPTYRKLRMLYIDEGDFLIIDKKDAGGKYDYVFYEQLSDGEKTILGLIMDIARRLILANPGLIEDKEKNASDVLNGRGIVLIDEIDAHLHPRWQHKVVPLLMELFPQIQFVITTHSPQVLVNVHSKHVQLLENYSVFSVSETYGHDIGSITEEVMGGWSSPFEADFRYLFALISDQNREEALKIFGQLKNKIEGPTPDLVKAQHSLIRRGWL